MRVSIDAINGSEQVRGPDRYLIGILEGLQQCGGNVEYVVFYAYWQSFFEALHLPDNFRFVRCTPPRHQILRVLWHIFVFPHLVKREYPDVVHLPNIIFIPFLSAPVVMTVHDVAHFRFPEKFGYFRGYTQRLLIRGAMALADAIIAVSEYTRQELHTHLGYPVKKVSVIGEGGPTPVDPPKTSQGPRYFLYVGQLERSKNIETLIDAFAESTLFADQGVELWIVGKAGNAATQIAQRIATLGQGRIKHLGYVGDAELPALYANALAFVFPSLVEGFGLVLLEAMAYGAPVIASDASAIPEVVGEAALLVNARDAHALQGAMERLCGDAGLRASLVVRGRQRLQTFSWEAAARQTLALYQEACR